MILRYSTKHANFWLGVWYPLNDMRQWTLNSHNSTSNHGNILIGSTMVKWLWLALHDLKVVSSNPTNASVLTFKMLYSQLLYSTLVKLEGVR